MRNNKNKDRKRKSIYYVNYKLNIKLNYKENKKLKYNYYNNNKFNYSFNFKYENRVLFVINYGFYILQGIIIYIIFIIKLFIFKLYEENILKNIN